MPDTEDPYGHNQKTRGRELFEKIIDPPSGDIRDTLYDFARASIAVVAALFLALLLLAAFFQGTGAIGQAGDFFGGFVNPLLTFLTFSGVLFTVYIQRQDLNETRNETRKQADFFERQNFEATFFQMLNLHNAIVNALEVEEYTGQPKVRGRECFRIYFGSLKQDYNDYSFQLEGEGMHVATEHAFQKFWNGHRQELGHYLRYLYNIIRYVDESILPESAHTQHELKMRYIKLLRAQLSDYELLILFYNALTFTGSRFTSYINRYDLLDNLPRDLLIRKSHRTDFPNIYFQSEPVEK